MWIVFELNKNGRDIENEITELFDFTHPTTQSIDVIFQIKEGNKISTTSTNYFCFFGKYLPTNCKRSWLRNDKCQLYLKYIYTEQLKE